MPIRDAARGSFNNKPYVVSNQNLTIWAGNANTNTAGAATFDISAAGFTTVYSAAAQVVRDTTDPARAAFATIRTASPTTVTVQVWESKTNAVLLLGANLESLEPTNIATLVALTVFGA